MNQTEANSKLVLRYVESFNRADFDSLREIFSGDAIVQGVLGQGGMDKVISIWRKLPNAFGIQYICPSRWQRHRDIESHWRGRPGQES
jgi:hypothetical protein